MELVFGMGIIMEFVKEIKIRDGRTFLLRNAREEDAEKLINYLKVTAAETPYLMREPEEITLTLEQERNFIRNQIDSKNGLLLTGELDGEHVGNGSINAIGNYIRYRHRCSVAIALYQKFCGQGLGRIMLETLLEVAKNSGYEQVELEVVTDNVRAINLYKNLGFAIYGTQKHNMKYKDNTYCDVHFMMKTL